MHIPSTLIPGSASYIAFQQLQRRQMVRDGMVESFRQLMDMYKDQPFAPELGQSLVHLDRAIRALSDSFDCGEV